MTKRQTLALRRWNNRYKNNAFTIQDRDILMKAGLLVPVVKPLKKGAR